MKSDTNSFVETKQSTTTATNYTSIKGKPLHNAPLMPKSIMYNEHAQPLQFQIIFPEFHGDNLAVVVQAYMWMMLPTLSRRRSSWAPRHLTPSFSYRIRKHERDTACSIYFPVDCGCCAYLLEWAPWRFKKGSRVEADGDDVWREHEGPCEFRPTPPISGKQVFLLHGAILVALFICHWNRIWLLPICHWNVLAPNRAKKLL